MQQKTRVTAQKSSAQGEPSPVQKSYVSPSSAPSSPPLTRYIRTNLGQAEAKPPTIGENHAARKYKMNPLALALASLKSPLEKKYRDSFYCGNTVIERGRTKAEQRENSEKRERGNYITYYCGCRHCITCSNLRTVDLIKGYAGAFDFMECPTFGTFTIPSVYAPHLKKTIRDMIKVTQKIKDKFAKRYKRGQQDWVFRGIRTIESNYSLTLNTFNPHINLLGDYKAISAFHDEWMDEHKSIHICPDAQCVKPANEGTITELFKYVAKHTEENREGKRVIDLDKLDIIFQAFQGIRTVQSFGIKRTKPEQKEQKQYTEQELAEIEDNTIRWEWYHHDWHYQGEPLTGYQPDEKDLNYISLIRDRLPLISGL